VHPMAARRAALNGLSAEIKHRQRSISVGCSGRMRHAGVPRSVFVADLAASTSTACA